MKKILLMFLTLACVVAVLALNNRNQKSKQNIVFTAIIEEVNENSILVLSDGNVEFDKASVGINDNIKYDFILKVGQRVEITILPEIRESYPVQVTATKIVLK